MKKEKRRVLPTKDRHSVWKEEKRLSHAGEKGPRSARRKEKGDWASSGRGHVQKQPILRERRGKEKKNRHKIETTGKKTARPPSTRLGRGRGPVPPSLGKKKVIKYSEKNLVEPQRKEKAPIRRIQSPRGTEGSERGREKRKKKAAAGGLQKSVLKNI